MKSIVYLWASSIKNRVLELRKKPRLLIPYSIAVLLVAAMVFLGRSTAVDPDAANNFPMLKLMFFALSTYALAWGVYRGVSAGGSFFDMSDVNFLFVSPLNPRAILLHGVIRQTKIAFFAGCFILFQSANLKRSFGLDFSSIMVIFAGFFLAMMLSEIIAMFIYSNTNGSPMRQNIAKAIAIAVFVPAAVKFALLVASGQSALTAAYSLSSSAYIDFIPASGWITRGCMDVISGNALPGLAFMSLAAAFGAALIIAITIGKIDYYEDVLCATESNYEKRRAKSEGKLGGMSSSKKVKVSKTGVSGSGASALFSKHLIESRRENILGIFSVSSIFFIVVILLIAVLARDSASSVIILFVAMWMQLVFIATGRGIKELLYHHIYLIPENSLAKLLWSNAESLLRVFFESLIMFTAAGLFLKTEIPVIAGCILAYTLFTLVLLGANYLSMRLFMVVVSRGILFFLYILAVAAVMAPGIAIFAILSALVGQTLGLLALALWEAAVSLAFFALSKGVLHNCDIVTVKEIG
ncbi:MAG: putative ABC exporter domain-containing protein [Clostridiales bacterium]|nr:putative ABC exporter domain-containing protein [Clostridiales bacterium]